MGFVTRLVAALALLIALLVVMAPALFPRRGQQIAFESYESGDGEIYLLDLATGIYLNLTHHPAQDGQPAWSPDGRYLAFASNRTDNSEIFVMDMDGSGVFNLSRHFSDDYDPTWSPDGTKIAFMSRREGNSEIYIMEVAAILADPACAALPDVIMKNPTQACAPVVRRMTQSVGDEISPVWSPDGRRIAFGHETDLDSEIYTIRAACEQPAACTAERYNLSDDPARDRYPAWSPDGRRLAFASERGGVWDIYTVSANGSQIQTLTGGIGAFTSPSWSPDGQQIVFAGQHYGSWGIFTCSSVPELCGGSLRRLTYNRIDIQPVWRP